MNDLNIANQVKNLLIYEEEVIVNVNNKYKILKNKILETSYEILELIYYTNELEITKRKYTIRKILVKIKLLDFYSYQLFLKKEITDKTYNLLSKKLITLTRMVYAWLKYKTK